MAVGPGILNRAEARWERRAVLERLELRLRERVVVGDMRPGMGLGHAEIGEQEGDGLGGHRRPAIGVDGKLPAVDALPATGLVNEPLGQRGALAMGHHPADHVATEDVEHDVEVEVGPLRGSEQLGDVPTPELVGPAGQQLGHRVAGVPELIPTLAHLLVGGEHAIHRALRAEVLAGVEQRGVGLRRREIHEPRLVQHSEDGGALRGTERAGRGPARRQGALGPPSTVVGCTRQPERRTRRRDAEPGPDRGHRRHQDLSSASGIPSNAATFFWTSTRASARSARLRHRAVSRSSSAIRLSRGSGTRGTGPRFFDAPARSPRSRAARHVVRCEEYNPSRRSSAPIAPGVLQPSASRTIFRLYSSVNCRRVAFAVTSISGPPRARSSTLIVLQSLLALDTKLPGGRCLTHIGREGTSRAHSNRIWPSSTMAWSSSRLRSLSEPAVSTRWPTTLSTAGLFSLNTRAPVRSGEMR